MKTPLLNEIWISLRYAQDFLNSTVLEVSAFVPGGMDKGGACGLRVELANHRISEQALSVGFGIAGKSGNLRESGPHKKHRQIALRNLVAGNNERC
ncbi:MAG TPA: hypothetical protein VMV39_08595 [Terracidiphilus sp.]|nr:hypothetical protein [Terracidiphilus sp.]